jgi:hypothetical protein
MSLKFGYLEKNAEAEGGYNYHRKVSRNETSIANDDDDCENAAAGGAVRIEIARQMKTPYLNSLPNLSLPRYERVDGRTLECSVAVVGNWDLLV